MKAGLVASAAVLAVILAALLMRGPGPVASAPPPDAAAPRPRASSPRIPDPGLRWPARDPFRYAEERRPPSGPPAGAATPPTPRPIPSTAASASPLRLIGLVRQSGVLKAALSMWGETVVLGAGEESRGYKVLSVDEEAGVRLRGPDGSELSLVPSSL